MAAQIIPFPKATTEDPSSYDELITSLRRLAACEREIRDGIERRVTAMMHEDYQRVLLQAGFVPRPFQPRKRR